jgi:DNA-binding transcriptional ArsR family regulator
MLALWAHIYGPGGGDQRIALYSGIRADGELAKRRPMSYLYPEEATNAAAWIERNANEGRETYMCGHLLTSRERKKAHAAPLWALYVDGDGATVPDHLPAPTAVVRSSPGREQFYWRLSRPVEPEIGEQMNRRLAYAMRADLSGWDLTQLLRPPGAPNRKYPDSPTVTLAELDDSTDYDPDELDRILPAAPAASIGRSHDVTDIGDTPPVDTITGSDLALWRGETPALKDGGEIDRSKTLYRIGAMLWRHGVTASWIVAALAERDQSLGLLRYVDRPDEYRRIAAKVSAEPRMLHIPQAGETTPPAAANDARLAALEAEIVILKAQVEQLRERADRAEELQRLTVEVLRNPDLKNMKATALAVVFTVGGLESSGKPGEYNDITPDGYVNVRRAEIASKAGVKEDAVTRHVTRMESMGLLEKRVQRMKKVDRSTGEVLKDDDGRDLYDTKLQIKLSDDTRNVLRRLAQPLDEEHRSNWGGERKRPADCEQHPGAAINVYRVLECAECVEEIGRELTGRHPAELEPDDPALLFDQEPQDAASEIPPPSVDSVPMGSKMQFLELAVPLCCACGLRMFADSDIAAGSHDYDCAGVLA